MRCRALDKFFEDGIGVGFAKPRVELWRPDKNHGASRCVFAHFFQPIESRRHPPIAGCLKVLDAFDFNQATVDVFVLQKPFQIKPMPPSVLKPG